MTVKIGIPRSLPYFFASLKISVTLAFVGSVIAEIVAGNNGIGNDADRELEFQRLTGVRGALCRRHHGRQHVCDFRFLERRMTAWSVRGTVTLQQFGG